jgi:protein SCO1
MLRTVLFGIFLVSGLAALPPDVEAHERHRAEGPPVRSAYAFPIAKPGTYRLPPIKPAAGGEVLDESGRSHDLARLLSGRTTVLAFIYTRCGDVCPAATLDMSRLQDLAGNDRETSRRMQLVTMSFDPEHDTPEVMRAHASQWRSGDRNAPIWLFLTSPGPQTLAPMLKAYNQPVQEKADQASLGGPLHHVFRAFLIDKGGLIRNIYSLDFFDPELVLNDVRTILMEK